MNIVYAYQDITPPKDGYNTVEAEIINNKLNITVHLHGGSEYNKSNLKDVYHISLNINDIKNNCYSIRLISVIGDNSDYEYPDSLYKLYAIKIYDFSWKFSNLGRFAKYICKIIYAPNTDTVYISQSHNGSKQYFSNSVIIPNNARHAYNFFLEKSDLAKTKILKFAKKSKLLNNVDFYDSLSYLEAQIDVLSHIIHEVILTHPELIPDEYKNFLDSVEQNSVLTIKDKQKLLEEITIKKKFFRDLQKEYYK